jgi:zinc transporter ZupT
VGSIGWVALLTGAADLFGGWLTLALAPSRERVEQFTALGAGFLLGGALLTMLPEALTAEGGALYVTAGYLGLFALRRLLAPATQETGACAGGADAGSLHTGTVAAVWAALMGMGIHSFLDGAALGTAMQADARLGWVAGLAVIAHKVPEGFTLSAMTMAATRSRRLALMAAGALGLAAVLGALLAFGWAGMLPIPHSALLGIAAGSFLYVGSADMLPTVGRQGGGVWLVLLGATLVGWLFGAGHRHH